MGLWPLKMPAKNFLMLLVLLMLMLRNVFWNWSLLVEILNLNFGQDIKAEVWSTILNFHFDYLTTPLSKNTCIHRTVSSGLVGGSWCANFWPGDWDELNCEKRGSFWIQIIWLLQSFVRAWLVDRPIQLFYIWIVICWVGGGEPWWHEELSLSCSSIG